MANSTNIYNHVLQESVTLRVNLARDDAFLSTCQHIGEKTLATLVSGSKILIAGNGGSAADAQHFAAELTGKFKNMRRAFPATALTTDTSFLTAWSNDVSFEDVFARQIEAHGRAGDLFFAISTSGDSVNLIKAIIRAKSLGITTVGLLGKDGGTMRELVDIPLVVPSESTARIQEVHITIIHAICEYVDTEYVATI